jgi:cysteine desulfurase/selenocysteine lyase
VIPTSPSWLDPTSPLSAAGTGTPASFAPFQPFDPAVLARLANELFQGPQGPPGAVGALPAPAVSPPVSAAPSDPLSALESVPSPLAGFQAPVGQVAPGEVSAPKVALQDPGSLPQGQLPSSAAPGQVPSSAAAPQAPSGQSAPGELPAQAAAPVSPQPTGFYFLDEASAAGNPFTAPLTWPDSSALQAREVGPADEPARPAATEPREARSPEAVPVLDQGPGPFDPNALRRDFPILRERVHGRPLIWLDNAATTQKPQSVIDRISSFYEHENSNIHRAAHSLAARSTDAYEAAREKVRRFLNAPSVKDIIFVRGATEAINLVAQAWGRRNVGPGDEIVITWLEHHSNIVPWQQLVAEKGAKLRVAPIDDRGDVILDEYEKLLNPRTRLVSLTHVSNALGTVNPVQEMVAMAHRHGALALVDGAQSVSHKRVDVQEIDADFFAFSGHKVFAPTGIGVLFGRSAILDETPPWQGGGNMIADVTFERTVFHPSPARFEAGTGNIADAVGLGAAIDYLNRVGLENVERYEHELLVYATGALRCVPGLRIIGDPRERAGVLSFVLDGQRSEDVGAALDREGIAVRSGHHCAQPALRRFGLESSVRPSLALYNTHGDIDALVATLHRLQSGYAGPPPARL